MNKKDVCHFCNNDYTEDNDIVLAEGPYSNTKICGTCTGKGLIELSNKKDFSESLSKCDFCGVLSRRHMYGQAPCICAGCLFTVMELTVPVGIKRLH